MDELSIPLSKRNLASLFKFNSLPVRSSAWISFAIEDSKISTNFPEDEIQLELMHSDRYLISLPKENLD